MYSRRSKRLSKKLLSKWQEGKRRWIIKVWKTLRRQTWRERVIAGGKKDPLICPHCDNYYIYRGEVCLENGQLEIKIAMTKEARNYLERMIANRTPVQAPQKREEKKKKGTDHLIKKKPAINYVCLTCHKEEEIPYIVVRDFDLMDGGDPTVPPQFSCEHCGEEMYPEYYKGVHGQEYKLSDVF